ncbi:MAG: phage major capsid protein [Burkholderiaceae bacterium]|nr:phage major capsid protein [Burkholderiaceae bacterium]
MNLDNSTVAKGIATIRYFRARSIASDGDREAACAWVASQNFTGSKAIMELLQRSGVSDTDDADLRGRNPALVDLAGAVRSASVLGKLPGVARLPFQSATIGLGAGARAYWRAAGKAVPVSRVPIGDPSILDDRSVYALLVARDAFLREAQPMAEQALAAELIRATAEAIDSALVDPENDGSGDAPASVTNSGFKTASTGVTVDAIDLDLGALVGALAHEDLSTARWVLHPRTAGYFARLRGDSGALAYPGIGVTGGTLLGIPAIVSAGVPISDDSPAETSVSLVIGSGIVMAGGDEIELRQSKHATLEMDTEPTGDAGAPTAQSAHQVSMFQNNLTAMMTVAHANWLPRRATIAATLTGVTY